VSSLIVTAKAAESVGPCIAATGLRADLIISHVHGHEKAVVLRDHAAVVYVGDTPDDIIAGLEAGAIPIGVSTGSFAPATLHEAGALHVLESLTEFPSWYDSWRGRSQ
jgi:phosphoglycolate phosphatase-like HAD superfamily hydrolase